MWVPWPPAAGPCRSPASLSRVFLFLCLFAGPRFAVLAQRSQGGGGRLRYKCPEAYRRIGNGCYYISDEKLTWRDAEFSCRDLAGGNLAKLNKRWKDRSVKRFLNRSEGERLERWIGTMYDFGQNTWIWSVGGEVLTYQGFSRRKPNDNYAWRCAVMDPIVRFRWSTRSCIEKKGYICEVPIKVVTVDGKRRKRLQTKKRKLNNQSHKSIQPLPDIETNQIT